MVIFDEMEMVRWSSFDHLWSTGRGMTFHINLTYQSACSTVSLTIITFTPPLPTRNPRSSDAFPLWSSLVTIGPQLAGAL